ncbi:MAG: hypothetical protein AAB519_03835 [Patescibacteria group bacterium]
MTWEQPDKLLEKAHRQFSRDIEYPETGSEERLVMVDHYNNALSVYESKAMEGIAFPDLMVTDENLTCGGTGTDPLPNEFLTFFRVRPELPAQLRVGSAYYREVSAAEGARFVMDQDAAQVFWIEGINLRSYPAISGSISFPYLKKATRIETGDETALSEIQNKYFISDFVTARLLIDNEDDTLYQQYNNDAIDKLDGMVGVVLAGLPQLD